MVAGVGVGFDLDDEEQRARWLAPALKIVAAIFVVTVLWWTAVAVTGLDRDLWLVSVITQLSFMASAWTFIGSLAWFAWWLHCSLRNASALGIPQRHQPLEALGWCAVPIVNLFVARQVLSALFPAGDPAGHLVTRWWLSYIGLTALAFWSLVAPFIVTVPLSLSIVLGLATASLAYLGAVLMGRIIDDAGACHRRLLVEV